MGGRIDMYIDLASLYSYIALVQYLKNRDLLKQHSVELEIHPMLLGGVNAKSGNKPPWTLPAKAAYGQYDVQRSLAAVDLTNVSPPGDLMEAGKTYLPLRALLYVKDKYPVETYLATWRYLLHAFWTLHEPPNTPQLLAKALSEAPAVFPPAAAGGGKGKRLFGDDDVACIVRAAADGVEYKNKLRETTERALGQGAFGAPWLWVTNAATGKSEPFFGSDRWYHVYEFLGLPFQNVALLPPAGSGVGNGQSSKL